MTYLPRVLDAAVRERLENFPVVILTGARQTGKSTLVRHGGLGDRAYLTLDDIGVRDQATHAPDLLLRRADRITLDEVQRQPELLLAIKRDVDEQRRPGRFLLTGSANLLLMERISESLAGRAVYLTLWPLTRRERLGLGTSGPWTAFFEEEPPRWRDRLLDQATPEILEARPWQEYARIGGYPVAAHDLRTAHAREQWFTGYVRTYLERDLQDLTAIEYLADYQRLMRALCLRLGNVLNQAELARDVGLPPSTAQRYLGLMEVSYQLVRVEPFSVNRTKRLVKSPKVFWSDTGLALHLSGEAEPRGAHLENMILHDLLAWREDQPGAPQILYWRTSKGQEVDFVVEWRNRVLPIEVKSGERVRTADLRSMRAFLDDYPDLAPAGIVLYGGTETYWMAERVLVVPWWRVL